MSDRCVRRPLQSVPMTTAQSIDEAIITKQRRRTAAPVATIAGTAARTSTVAVALLLVVAATLMGGVSAANECASSPCANGGTCVQGVNSYTCTCDPNSGYSGPRCDCDDAEPCQNGGTCVGGIIAPCQCTPGYIGYYCEIFVDPCGSSPCTDGNGQCVTNPDGISYHCDCFPGSFGDRCQTKIDQCASQPCMNGGQCNTNFGYWQCECLQGYTGLTCQTLIDFCAPHPCVNGGSCTSAPSGYTCACVPGYTGRECQSDLSECASQPCQNGGICSEPSLNRFQCACPLGTVQPMCADNVNECASNPCASLPNSHCVDGIGMYSCVCNAGYSGNNCAEVDECLSNPCGAGGSCVNLINAYSCQCYNGFQGPNCATNIDECASMPCAFGGTCTDGAGGYVCACPAGMGLTQPNCYVDSCGSNPCQSGGTCTNTADGFRCDCLLGFQGATCETYVDPCGTVAAPTCLNNSTCNVTESARGFEFKCTCAIGYNGTRCEQPFDFCNGACWYNRGICEAIPSDFICHCFDGYSGRNCQFKAEPLITKSSAVPWDEFSGRSGGILAGVVVFILILIIAYKCWKKRKADYAAYAQKEAAAKSAEPVPKPVGAGKGGKLTGAFTAPTPKPGKTASSPASANRLRSIQKGLQKIEGLLPHGSVPGEPASPRARAVHAEVFARLQRIRGLMAADTERSTIGIGMDSIGINLRVPDEVLSAPSRYAEFDTRLMASAAVAIAGTASNAGGLAVSSELSTDESDAQAVSDNKLPELVDKAETEADGADEANLKFDEL